MRQTLRISERRACRTLGQHRSTQRKEPRGLADEERLTEDIIELAREFGRYGYRMITGMLNNSGWHVNHKRVERIWRREGLKVPQKQARKGRLWLNDGSCVRLRPERPNHVWSYDFVQDRTQDGRVFRTLNIIDEFTKEALVIRVKRKLNSTDVVDALTDLFILRGPPEFIRSDNGAEFISKKVQAWIGAMGAKRLSLRQDRRGRTATARASTPGSGTKCSMEKSSTPCARHRSSSRGGDATTTPSGRTAP